MNLFKITLLGFFLGSVGCAHSVHEVHVSDFSRTPIKNGALVKASSEQQVFLWMVNNTDYVDQARQELIKSCDGELTGITTQYSTALGFLSWKNRILLQGLCMKN